MFEKATIRQYRKISDNKYVRRRVFPRRLTMGRCVNGRVGYKLVYLSPLVRPNRNRIMEETRPLSRIVRDLRDFLGIKPSRRILILRLHNDYYKSLRRLPSDV